MTQHSQIVRIRCKTTSKTKTISLIRRFSSSCSQSISKSKYYCYWIKIVRITSAHTNNGIREVAIVFFTCCAKTKAHKIYLYFEFYRFVIKPRFNYNNVWTWINDNTSGGMSADFRYRNAHLLTFTSTKFISSLCEFVYKTPTGWLFHLAFVHDETD